jgi:hypothetical protein
MGGSTKAQLDLLEQKIKFTLRPLINAINTSGMNRERRIQLDSLLLEISNLQQSLENQVKQEGMTESKIRLTGLEDYLYTVIKGADIQVDMPERRQQQTMEEGQRVETQEEAPKPKPVRILSLNMGGMRLLSPTPLKVGSMFRTRIKSSRHGIVSLEGEVVWSQEDEGGEGHIAGVHFSTLDEETTQALEYYLEERGE